MLAVKECIELSSFGQSIWEAIATHQSARMRLIQKHHRVEVLGQYAKQNAGLCLGAGPAKSGSRISRR